MLILKLIATFGLVVGAIWSYFPGAFGLLNYKKNHASYYGQLATSIWWLLLLSHPIALVGIWWSAASFGWLLLPLVLHLIFFATFGRNVSAQ